MESFSFPILTLMIFIPIIGMLILAFLKQTQLLAIRTVSAVFSGIPLVLAIILLINYDPGGGFQFIEKVSWIPSLNINYFLGADGISVPMLVLTALLSFISIIASFGITHRAKEYFVFFLLLEIGMMGVFAALDFFLFYIFWEIMLVPMYFLIGIWGGPRKIYAAIKFFLYTLFGSIFMLVGILILYFSSVDPSTGAHIYTLDLTILAQMAQDGNGLFLREGLQLLVWMFFFIAFAIKVPVWPFHTWLPDAHVEAPTAVSVILAGVLLKMGTYGLLRISFPILPYGTDYFSTFLAVLGVIGIIYGALVSMAQKDLKKLVAYSSVSHMGYCLLGMSVFSHLGQEFNVGFSGAMFQMVSHGLITGALFLLVGVIYDRAHTREIAAFGGLWTKVPVYGSLMTFFCMASLGLPGLSGFISEFLVFVGGFAKYKILTGIAVLGVVLTAGYFLRMIQKVFLGQFNIKWSDLTEINFREIFTVTPLAILTILIGIYPRVLSYMIDDTLSDLSNSIINGVNIVKGILG
ncbi:MAG: NADH-quinone oxidoreductase subunit M [candidate division Zixibacteria bacterium]|nr:NADH-quinone oxidoreductase subunit M [candidate division Zixibacteria bacterium]NIR66030.1 NADH-quinone oxidoreductase subunit M [candidate division Zixibacteria bacterium]NIS17052.1 NADH-quinone oxidoreductase subunit M [candidate division Zixibacteria bacterium]NIS47660.1 NADH-quinone oxidoreductase subunit M [candidate division Zixibacteria bacterium]NIT53422.1 NADH-quinone oxidoreductase subunit M [candidate division Zixibacteria bacterium]